MGLLIAGQGPRGAESAEGAGAGVGAPADARNTTTGRNPALLIAGVDEVGRGPLAGPVVAAAVILDPNRPIQGLADSKQLTPLQRQELDVLIRETALAWALGRAEVEEIDRLNILQASLLAMQRAVAALGVVPAEVWVDGKHAPSVSMLVRTVVGGDATVPAISAASIVAKVSRDAELSALDVAYPGYGFARHKGYATPEHLEALARIGASAIHRRSFAPVQQFMGRPGEGSSDALEGVSPGTESAGMV